MKICTGIRSAPSATPVFSIVRTSRERSPDQPAEGRDAGDRKDTVRKLASIIWAKR
jgi:hypothetical protein